MKRERGGREGGLKLCTLPLIVGDVHGNIFFNVGISQHKAMSSLMRLKAT